MGIEHEVTPTLMELKDRIVSLETKLAAYEQGPDDTEVREAENIAEGRMHEDGSIAECPHCGRLSDDVTAKDARIAELEARLLAAEHLRVGDGSFDSSINWKSHAENAEAKVADLSARLEEARRLFADCGDCYYGDDYRHECAAHKMGGFWEQGLAHLDSPSPVGALKDKVVEAAIDIAGDISKGTGPHCQSMETSNRMARFRKFHIALAEYLAAAQTPKKP